MFAPFPVSCRKRPKWWKPFPLVPRPLAMHLPETGGPLVEELIVAGEQVIIDMGPDHTVQGVVGAWHNSGDIIGGASLNPYAPSLALTLVRRIRRPTSGER